MYKIVRKQLKCGLCICFFGAGVAGATEPPTEHTLNGQTQLVIQHIAQFLSAKDCMQLAHTSHAIHEALAPKIEGVKQELKKQFLQSHHWKIEMKPEEIVTEAPKVLQDFEAFRQKMDKHISRKKTRYGVEVDLGFWSLRQEGISRVLGYLVTAIKNHKCEIVELNLSSNHLSQVPSEVYQMTYLKKLDLGSNPLQYTGGMFKGIPPIAKLDLSDTNLSQIPEHLFDGLDHVEFLSLYVNQLAELSYKEIKSLVSLCELNLVDGNLLRLSNDVAQHKTLSKIYIFGNPRQFVEQLRLSNGLKENNVVFIYNDGILERVGA